MRKQRAGDDLVTQEREVGTIGDESLVAGMRGKGGIGNSHKWPVAAARATAVS